MCGRVCVTRRGTPTQRDSRTRTDAKGGCPLIYYLPSIFYIIFKNRYSTGFLLQVVMFCYFKEEGANIIIIGR